MVNALPYFKKIFLRFFVLTLALLNFSQLASASPLKRSEVNVGDQVIFYVGMSWWTWIEATVTNTQPIPNQAEDDLSIQIYSPRTGNLIKKLNRLGVEDKSGCRDGICVGQKVKYNIFPELYMNHGSVVRIYDNGIAQVAGGIDGVHFRKAKNLKKD